MENKPKIELLGAALENIENISFINEGGFKAVYEVIINGKKEALKVIFIPRETDEPEAHTEILLRVKREIESLDQCNCPYIVKLGTLTPTPYVIQNLDYIIYTEEFLQGKTLLEHIKAGFKPNLKECKALFICFLVVISELKRNGLIHRDIKPGNVFALGDPSRPYVVLDLGIAFKLRSTAITKNPEVRIGTLPYMSPELFNPNFRELIDYRSDLYSAAVTLYEYASGVHPIARRGEDDFTTIYRIANMRPSPLSIHRPDLPPSFCHAIDQLIRKKPALRPSNLEELIKKMEAVS